MKRQSTILLRPIWMIMLIIAVMACGQESPPAPSPRPVSQKIAVQQTQPPAAQPATPSASQPAAPTTVEPVTPSTTQSAAPAMVQPAAPQGTEASPAVEVEAMPARTEPVLPSELVQESLQMVSSYDSTGRVDPFEPLFKEQTSDSAAASKGKREKRAPQTPLERVSLSQLKLTAIIRAPSGNSALVEDTTGKGYVIKKGTYIGLNSGRVVDIDNNRVLIEEEVENVMGELTIQNAEIKLQKPAGEL